MESQHSAFDKIVRPPHINYSNGYSNFNLTYTTGSLIGCTKLII